MTLEHEQCLKDVLELKWHISYKSRQLARAQDALRVTGEQLGWVGEPPVTSAASSKAGFTRL